MIDDETKVAVAVVSVGVVAFIALQYLLGWGLIHAALELIQLTGLMPWEPTWSVTAALTGSLYLLRLIYRWYV